MKVWLILIFLSAIFGTIAVLLKKKCLLKEHTMEYLSVFKICEVGTIAILIPFLDFSITLSAVFFVYLFSLGSALTLLLINKSYRHMELSVAAPLTNLSPAILLVFAFILLGERITHVQFAGISLLVLGTYVLEADSHSHDLFAPFKKIYKSRYSKFLLMAMVFTSILAVAEKHLLNGIHPATFLAMAYGFASINFFILSSMFYGGYKDVIHGFKNAGKLIIPNAIFSTLSNITYLFALSMTFVSLAIPIKKISNFFIVLLSGSLFKEERIFKKSFACLIMIAGVFLIAV